MFTQPRGRHAQQHSRAAIRARGRHRKPPQPPQLGRPAAAMAMVPVAAGAISALPQHHVTVRAGDTLSGIAVRYCHGQANDWTGIFAANRRVIKDPNLIYTGQVLTLPKCTDPAQFLPLAAPARTVTVSAAATRDGDGDYDHDASDGTAAAAPVSAPAASSGGYGNVSTAGMGGYQQCVITRESGGDSQIWNASGHYGLYQFSAGTWAAAGGNPADFGHASIAEQNQVFASAYAKWGTQPWTPSDGC